MKKAGAARRPECEPELAVAAKPNRSPRATPRPRAATPRRHAAAPKPRATSRGLQATDRLTVAARAVPAPENPPRGAPPRSVIKPRAGAARAQGRARRARALDLTRRRAAREAGARQGEPRRLETKCLRRGATCGHGRPNASASASSTLRQPCAGKLQRNRGKLSRRPGSARPGAFRIRCHKHRRSQRRACRGRARNRYRRP
jgi:hypothetical protein